MYIRRYHKLWRTTRTALEEGDVVTSPVPHSRRKSCGLLEIVEKAAQR